MFQTQKNMLLTPAVLKSPYEVFLGEIRYIIPGVLVTIEKKENGSESVLSVKKKGLVQLTLLNRMLSYLYHVAMTTQQEKLYEIAYILGVSSMIMFMRLIHSYCILYILM